MTWDERFDELDELGRHIWEALPADRREQHRIDRQRLSQGAQCVCTCGAACPHGYFPSEVAECPEMSDLTFLVGDTECQI